MRYANRSLMLVTLTCASCGVQVVSHTQTVAGDIVNGDTPYALSRTNVGSDVGAAKAAAGSEAAAKANAAPTPTPAMTPTPTTTDTLFPLYTRGNHIYTADGKVWHGVGANIQDPRGGGACLEEDLDASTGEVIRRVDELVDNWHATYLRLTLESVGTSSLLDNDAYLQSIEAIVQHISEKPGVVVEVSIWNDPTLSTMGWPTPATEVAWTRLVKALGKYPMVIYGMVNEPQYNMDGALDGQVWQALNHTAEVIRQTEHENGFDQHIIATQGTGGWARFLDYYTRHPLTAGGGTNIAYEVHVYDDPSTFAERFTTPAQTLPVIIGEFGPVEGMMTLDDCAQLMTAADAAQLPYAGWTFHMRCPPNLLEDHSDHGCGIGMPLVPTAWGRMLKSHLLGTDAAR